MRAHFAGVAVAETPSRSPSDSMATAACSPASLVHQEELERVPSSLDLHGAQDAQVSDWLGWAGKPDFDGHIDHDEVDFDEQDGAHERRLDGARARRRDLRPGQLFRPLPAQPHTGPGKADAMALRRVELELQVVQDGMDHLELPSSDVDAELQLELELSGVTSNNDAVMNRLNVGPGKADAIALRHGGLELQVVQDGMQLEVEPPPPPATLVVEEALVPSSGVSSVSESVGYACMGY